MSIFFTKTAVLGNNVKNLVILIPDEAHHGNGEPKEARFIDQSFLPNKAIVNKGTSVMWFSGDVSHEHKILVDGGGAPNSVSPSPYDSGVLMEFTASNPATFNAVGSYAYSSPEIDQKAEQKGFVMRGDIVVTDQPSKLMGPDASSSINNADTVGIYMVPTKQADEYISQFKNKGFSIDSTYSFKDVRGLARGTDSEQTLVVWTAGPEMGVGTNLRPEGDSTNVTIQMTLTDHFLGGVDDMLKLFRTARFLFGLLAVLSLLLLLRRHRTEQWRPQVFWIPTSADEADEDHGGRFLTWRCR